MYFNHKWLPLLSISTQSLVQIFCVSNDFGVTTDVFVIWLLEILISNTDIHLVYIQQDVITWFAVTSLYHKIITSHHIVVSIDRFQEYSYHTLGQTCVAL